MIITILYCHGNNIIINMVIIKNFMVAEMLIISRLENIYDIKLEKFTWNKMSLLSSEIYLK